MGEFVDFNEWCKYWSQEFSSNVYKWRDFVSKGIDNDDESYQYIAYIEFKSSIDAKGAMHDVCTYGKDYGYGEPASFIDNEYSEKYWNIYLTCPDLPLVIRMANNHDGVMTSWNGRFLKCPPKNIPFYIPSKPAPKTKRSGCYVATAVYGSYDCPEVWTLRRYRDNVMDESWYGRLFIRIYYAVSPTLVKWFGETKWFRNLLKNPLNRWVSKLNKKGVENTPYNDKY